MKVFALGCVFVPTNLKVDCTLIMNLLWFNSKHELVWMCNIQQLVMIELIQWLWECSNCVVDCHVCPTKVTSLACQTCVMF